MTIDAVGAPLTRCQMVAAEIRAQMGRRNLKQVHIAAYLHMAQSNVSPRLRGERDFTLDELDRLAAWFGVPITALLGDPAPLSGPGGPQGTEPYLAAYVAELTVIDGGGEITEPGDRPDLTVITATG